MEEVHELLDVNGGGNLAALHVWLQNAPPVGGRYPGGSRPKAGDRIEIFKQFVMDCYEYGKFKATTPYQPSAGATQAHSPVSPKPQPAPVAVSVPTQAPRPPASVPATQNVNLLEVDDFFSSSSSTSPKPTSSITTTSSSSSGNDFANFANFSSFSSTQQSQSTSVDFDPFGNTSVTSTSHQHSFSATTSSHVHQVTSQSSNTKASADFDLFNVSSPSANAFQQPSAVQSQPPQLMQPQSSTAFDPFGSNVLTPTSISPTVPSNTNVFNFGQQSNFQPQNNMHNMGGTYQQQQAQPPHGNVNKIMDMYSQAPSNSYQPRPMNAMGRPTASLAISQIDVFSGQSNARPMGGMSYNSMQQQQPMQAYPSMQQPQVRMQPSSAPQSNGSFDFLQETMKKHLDNPSSNTGYYNNGMRQPPQHPFK